jgi:membrane-bound serine protease (ClpP class)
MRSPHFQLIITLLAGVSALAAPPAHPRVDVLPLRGTIDPATSAALEAAIVHAEGDGAELLVVELDTPGGLVASVREMDQAIDASRIPVVVYVTPAGGSATSAGALLTLASHVAAMAPGTNIGAAHPVGSSGEDIKGTMGQKVVNDVSAFARGLAELRGRNVGLAEDVVARSRSFTAEEALRGGLIEIIAPSRGALLSALDGRRVKLRESERALHTRDAEVVEDRLSFGQALLHTLANPNIAALLMTLGMLLIYVEVSHPGTVIPGISGAICLLVAFMAFHMLPIRAGALALVGLGALLLLAEPFVVAHGAMAAGGIVSFVLGLVWLLDPSETSLHVAPWAYLLSAGALGVLVAAIAISVARLRRRSHEALEEMGGAGVIAGIHGYTGTVEEAGPGGKAGKARFRGELWDFESAEELRPGDAVVATGVKGLRLKLARAKGPGSG